jgi:amino acid adenylation domain-containing protein
MQQGMLFDYLKSEQPGVNIEQMICSLHETLNLLTFTQAWQRVIERHPVLRTSFGWQGLDVPLQTVHPEVQLPLEQQDWRHLSASEQEDKLQAYLQADAECGFDLTKAPLMRLALFQLTESDYKIVWTFHHLLLDGRSLLILLKEVFAFYEAFCQGEDLQLEQPRPYSDYIEWLQQQDFSKAEAFWKQTLRGFSVPTPLVVERSARGGHSQELGHGQEQILLSEAVTSALKSLAQEHELTLNTVVNGAWALLLSRYSGEEDVVFGATRACLRSALEEGESMVGLLINTLPLRVCVSPEQSVLPLLKEIRSQWMALRDYEHTPLGQVQTWSDIARGTSLFQSIVVFENYQLNFVLQEQGGSWEKREFELVEQTSFALAVAGYDGTELLLKIKYDRDLFEAERIEEILDQFQHLLMQVVEHPEERIANFSLVTPKAQLILPNPTQALCSKWDGAIHTRFSQNVQRVPQQPAIVDAQVSWNYAELEERTNLLANYLLAHHIQPQEIVAIYAHRSACLVWAMLGVLKAGAAFVILDPAYPASRLIDYLQISQPRAFLHITAAGELPKSLSEYLETLSGHCHLQLTQESIEVIRRQFSGYGNHHPGVEVEPDDLAYIPFTSGSTGKPKGIFSTHRPLSHFLQWHCQTFGFNQSDRFSMLSGLSHDPLIRDIFTPLTLGATLCIPQQQDIETPGRLAEWMAQQKITVSHLTPPMGQLLTVNTTIANTYQRYFFFGGDVLTVQDVDRITKFAPFATCVNFYGATETPQAMGYFIVPKPEERNFSKQVIPVGKGIADVQLLILNSLQQLADIDELGEIYVRTPYLAKGYIGSEELTSDRFIINPFTNLPEDRLYKTGDLGRYLPSGDIEFLGRSDYQVKIRGFRIELAEIEALLNQYPNVPENVVIAREDELGNKRLVAYIVAPSEPAPNTSELRQFLQKQLPDYMIPSAFVMLEALPLTPNGKIDRRALPAPDWSHREAENSMVNPRNELEKQLTLIWEQVLGVKPIGVKDNFFDLGGHSLLTLRLLNEIEKTLNTKLPVVALFQLTTVEKMASFFQQENRSAGSSTQEPILDSATVAEQFNDSSPEYSGLTTEEYRTLLAIVAGRKGKRPRQNSLMVAISEQGVKPPVFFCANASEEALPLAKNLGKEQPFYLLESGLVVTGNVESKIKAIAAHHVKDILLIQPEPPYLLCGYSFGAVLIDEIAQQLLAKGKQVSLVVILDRYGYQPIYRLYAKLVTFLTDHWHHLAPLSFRDKLRYIQENLKRLRSKRFPKSTEGEKSQPPYTSQAYPGKVILFCCIPNKHDSVPSDREIPIISSKFTLLFFRRAGWDKRVRPDLEIITVPGDHISMQQEPHVKVLAEKLQVCLDQAVIKTEQKNLGDSAPAS